IKPFEKDEFLARIATILKNNQRRKTIYGNSTQTTLTYAQEPEDSFRARWLKELDAIIGKNIAGSHVKVSDLAFQMAESERTFRNRIKTYTGRSPHEYLTEARMNKARYLLENQVYLTVAEVANAVGLDHGSYFTKRFKERFGRTPSEFL
ncbi:MAG: helix-turn-helix transcriptional regulator, partial [Saprospiraceae bacterium]